MVSNDSKQQVLGVAKEVKTAWGPVGDNATPIANDLGLIHYAYSQNTRKWTPK